MEFGQPHRRAPHAGSVRACEAGDSMLSNDSMGRFLARLNGTGSWRFVVAYRIVLMWNSAICFGSRQPEQYVCGQPLRREISHSKILKYE